MDAIIQQQDGVIEVGGYSSLLTRPCADSFARCLNSNEYFADVWVRKAPRARGEKCWRVWWKPASGHGRDLILERQLAMRTQRAVREDRKLRRDADPAWPYSYGYLWEWNAPTGVRMDDREGRRWWRVETISRQTYELDEDGRHCGCEDKELRQLEALGLSCKHEMAFTLRLGWMPDGTRLADELAGREFEAAFTARVSGHYVAEANERRAQVLADRDLWGPE